MAKIKTSYVCKECGYKTPKWMGKCPECNNWNTLVDTSTSIKCTTCNTTYCQNCGTGLSNSVYKRRPESDVKFPPSKLIFTFLLKFNDFSNKLLI